jgi:hypothetical protein
MDSEIAGDEILPRLWKYMTADETLVSTRREHEREKQGALTWESFIPPKSVSLGFLSM